MTGNGAGRGAPAWQRPPFATDNTVALTHGAYSPAVLNPVAAQLVEELLESPSCPPHLLEDPERWKYALGAWGRAEGRVLLLESYQAGMDAGDGLSELTEAEETTEHGKGKTVKRITARRRESTQAALDRVERHARNCRNDLGLTPMAAARMRLEVADKYDSALHVQAVLEQDSKREGGSGE